MSERIGSVTSGTVQQIVHATQRVIFVHLRDLSLIWFLPGAASGLQKQVPLWLTQLRCARATEVAFPCACCPLPHLGPHGAYLATALMSKPGWHQESRRASSLLWRSGKPAT